MDYENQCILQNEDIGSVSSQFHIGLIFGEECYQIVVDSVDWNSRIVSG